MAAPFTGEVPSCHQVRWITSLKAFIRSATGSIRMTISIKKDDLGK
jgi:hypothetical protein